MNENKKRLGCLKPFLIAFLGFICLVLIWLACNLRSGPASGQPIVDVGSQTTVISEPLDENGDPDFLAAINAENSAGVTPEKNAVVKLVEVIGVSPQLNSQVVNAFFEALGTDVPENEATFVSFDAFSARERQRIHEQFMARQKEREETGNGKKVPADELFGFQVRYAQTHPWSAGDFPDIDQWLQENESALLAAREGIAREQYFYPLVSVGTPRVMGANLAWMERFRDVAEGLSVSAMRHLEQGDIDQCLEEIYAIHRLSNHVASGATIVEELVAIALANKACNCIGIVCASGKADAGQLEQMLKWSASLKPVGGVVNRIDQMERWMGIDAVISMARGNKRTGGLMSDMEAQVQFVSRFVDWNEALTVMNANYDRCVEVVRAENFDQMVMRWGGFEEEMKEMEIAIMQGGIKSVFLGRKSKGKWAGEMFSNLLLPAAGQISIAEYSAKAKLLIMQHAIAACLYKKEHGSWPESPADVESRFAGGAPIDPVSGLAFEYVDEDGVFEVRSVRWNQGGGGLGLQASNLRMQLKIETWQEYLLK